MDLAPLRGTADLLPPRSDAMLGLMEAAHDAAGRFGYRYVETPAIEQTELFVRTSGVTSDIVTKEMYTFEVKGGRSITLRPEPTAPVVRAYLANRQALPVPFKAYYIAPNWRHSRPQAGRLREFRQFGVEVIGASAPGADVEVITLADGFLRDRGLKRLSLQVNSIGDEMCRPAYRDLLVAYLEAHKDELQDEHRERFRENPLRVLDCKDEACRSVTRGAPKIVDHLCDACEEHFAGLRGELDAQGVAYDLDPYLVRGLDYYTRTAFEFVSGALSGQQSTVCGGGRYDGLAEVLGGERTPGVGFGLGLDRLLLAMELEGGRIPPPRTPMCHVVGIGPDGSALARRVVGDLRAAGIAAERGFEPRPLKGQLRQADRAGARYAVIIGEREVAEGTVTMRSLADGDQETVPLQDAVAWVSKRA
jgi:histidyl-tRNA synthetase